MTDVHAERLRESLPDDVRLVVVADHGMVDVGPEDRTDVDQEPDLQEGLVLVAGEAPFRHLFCPVGAVEDRLVVLREGPGERPLVLPRGDAVPRGWCGPV